MAAPTPIRPVDAPSAVLADHDAERRALAACILRPDFLREVELGEADFDDGKHCTIWRAIRELEGDGDPIDTDAVFALLERQGKAERVGGLGYLTTLTDTIPSRPPVERLRTLRLQREALAVSARLKRAAEAGDIEDARRALDAGTELLREPAPATPPYQLLSQMAASALKPVGHRFATGFPTLDEATRGGIPMGRLVVSGGAPGSGKTSLSAQFTDSFEQQGCAVVYLAADEPADGIITRLGQLAGFSRDALEGEGDIGDAVRAGFAKRAEGRAIVVIDPEAHESARTIEDAERVLDELANGRPRVLVVDSLQTAQCRAAETSESARERIDAKMAVLKAIAKRGTLVLAITEMARAGYRSGDRNQDTSALAASKESGSIEYSASLLFGLRSVKGEHGQVDVEVAKNRLGGAKPEFRMKLDAERARFEEIERPDAETQKEGKADVRMERAKERVRNAVRENRDLKSKRDILAKCDGGRTPNLDAVSEMERRGELVHVGGFFRLQKEAYGTPD